mgnify:FL=1
MAKKESTFTNMVLTLFVVTALSSLAAAAVYNITKEPIAEVQRLKQQKAIEQVMPGFTQLARTAVMPETGPDSLVFFKGYRDTTELGFAVTTYTYIGYSGYVKMMVGFTPQGIITNVKVIDQKETPGLGTKMVDSMQLIHQVVGKNPAEFKISVKKDGGQVDAITAATISSRAFCDAVNRAYKSIDKIEKQAINTGRVE